MQSRSKYTQQMKKGCLLIEHNIVLVFMVRLTFALKSGPDVFDQHVCFLGIKPMTSALLTPL